MIKECNKFVYNKGTIFANYCYWTHLKYRSNDTNIF